ncbi:hypothetical protein C7S13_5544 [Burkholderia cepacia]|nr:hypothetical protein [Burkholderia cepacia]
MRYASRSVYRPASSMIFGRDGARDIRAQKLPTVQIRLSE